VNHSTFEAIRTDLAASGVSLPDELEGVCPPRHGFQVAWKYEPSLGRLQLQLDGPGILMGTAWGLIERHILPHVGR
jgi:hypothetical protein